LAYNTLVGGRERGGKAELCHGLGPAIDKSFFIGEDLGMELLELA
jgi:hypothetical protein